MFVGRFALSGLLGPWVIAVDPAFIAWHFFKVYNRILLHIVLLKCQITFLKFTSCDNQALVGCIPIAAVAVHLNLKS